MTILNEVMYKFAELLEKLPETTESIETVELIPNTFAELQVDGPLLFTENLFIEASENETDAILKEKKHPLPDSNIIEKAHPKPVYVSNALGDGGLVENQNEQQLKIQQMINKHPTGNLTNLYAEVAYSLAKIANSLEAKGQKSLATQADELLEELVK